MWSVTQANFCQKGSITDKCENSWQLEETIVYRLLMA